MSIDSDSGDRRERFKKLKDTATLPSPKGLAFAIILLTQQENVEVREIVRLVKSDPAIAGALLKFANAAKFGGIHIASLNQAIIRLGLPRVRQIVLGVSLLNEYRVGYCKAFDYKTFWAQSLAAAIAAQEVSSYINFSPEESFTCGLLAEIGRLALATVFPDEYGEILQAARQLPTKELLNLETQRFGIDHREVAACLLEDWGLPMIFLQAVEHHEFPDQANFPLGSGAHALTQAIHFATLLGKACVADITARWQLLPTLYHVGAQLGISVESMASTFDSVTATWQEWGALLEVSTPVLPSLSEIEALGPLFLKEQERRGKGQASNPVQLGVLIVSSNKSLLKDIRNELSKSNYAITETATLGLAPTGPGEGSEQLIIYDWVNGAHDAPDLAQAPRWGNDKRPRHFIALLPAGQEPLIPKAIEAGFDDYIQMPLSGVTLRARLLFARKVLCLHEGIQIEREGVLRNADAAAQTNRRLLLDALTDPLTGLPNRRYGMDRLEQEGSLASSRGLPLCCLMIDIDHFKAVNDTHGHDVGDRVLCQVAKILLRAIRKEDVVFRYGGEEFLVLCPATPHKAAVNLAERIREPVTSAYFGLQEPFFRVTVSIGMAAYDANDASVDAMTKRADEALYRAKREGRNRVIST